MPLIDINNSKPQIDINTKQPRLKSNERNALHDFATYNCLFTLSGINEEELKSQRRLFGMPIDRDVIAKSAGIGDRGGTGVNFPDDPGRNEKIDTSEEDIRPTPNESYAGSRSILGRRHDIFFENVNITSVVGPNVERNLANFTKMEFELHEPYSVTFIEKIRACAYNNGYLDYQAAPFLLTIEWKGFDENGQPLEDKTKSLQRRVPIFITRVEFDVDQGGARYNVTAVPYNDMAFDDSYKFPRTSFQVSVNSVQSWINDVKEALDTQMEQEADDGFRKFPDLYEFDISKLKNVIGNGEIVKRENESVKITAAVKDTVVLDDVGLEMDDPQIRARTKNMNVDKNSSLIKAFEDVIRSTAYYQDLLDDFWSAYAKGESDDAILEKFMKPEKMSKYVEKNQYVDWFMIKPKIENFLDKGLDPITKMYPKKITYEAIPYKVHVLKLILPGFSVDLDWSKYARRNYNYIYTGENVDIQNLRINYKTAYYYRNVRDDKKAAGGQGKLNSLIESVKKFITDPKPPEPALPLRQYPSALKTRNMVAEINPKSERANEFFDYLVNPVADMISIEMEILGDPAYVAQDVFAPLDDKVLGGDEFDDQNNAFNMQSHMPVITLDYRIPADIDEEKGKMFSDKYLDDNLFFSGAYQVTKVESSMNQGEFKQTLTLVRLNNQSGLTAPPQLVNASQSSLRRIFDEETLARFNRKEYGKYFRGEAKSRINKKANEIKSEVKKDLSKFFKN